MPYIVGLSACYTSPSTPPCVNCFGPARNFTRGGDNLFRQVPYDEHCTDWVWQANPSGHPLTSPSLAVLITPNSDPSQWQVALTDGHDCTSPGLGQINYSTECANVYPYQLGDSLTINSWYSYPSEINSMSLWCSELYGYYEHLFTGPPEEINASWRLRMWVHQLFQ